METRYTRRQLQPRNNSSCPDLYNSLLLSPQGTPLEYWTNGRTTLLMSNDIAGAIEEGRRTIRRMTTSPPYNHLTQTDANTNSNLVRNSLIAGSVSGMVSTVALYPLDVVRTKLQASGLAEVVTMHSAQTHAQHAPLPRGPLQMFRHTLQHGGFRALYTGMSLPLAAQAIYKGTLFTVNNVTQAWLLDYRTLENHKLGCLVQGELTAFDRFLSGCLGGAVNAYAFVTPVEFVRNQLIAQHSKQAVLADAAASGSSKIWNSQLHQLPSSWSVIRNSVQRHGISSLWRGASWSVARDGWGCGWFFVTNHYVQQYLSGGEDQQPSFAVTVAAGGVAGLVYWVSSLPMDTVKTWIQSAELGEHPVTATESIRTILREQGFHGVFRQLFRGWQVAYGRGIPSAAITISIYSTVYQSLH